ncbi:MAG: amidotransferase 1, exosortase A system-associated [Hyphococcus sp.]|nr:MAG: amidotransferase 1, exosortase A system-associated [Marinicaulis sp.]
MCGVAGIIDLKAARDINRDALTRMTTALTHRGPDGEGFFIEPGIGLGHRRLAIIDKQGGVQPFHTQSEKGVLSYNGEIYNYRSLAKSLEASGIVLNTRSDTEVLAEGLARSGATYISELRGMFALAFWDKEASRLILARDRIGEKPLYYTEIEDGFLYFASELGALLSSGAISAKISPEAVADYFFYGYVPDPKSIYKDIHKLAPAHTLIAGPGCSPKLNCYWRPQFKPDHSLSFEEACEDLRERLDDAVSTQMVSDVPLGAFLSGGVDSAGIVSAMSKTGQSPITCTIGFNEETHDERAPARQIAKKFGATHFEETADIDACNIIDDVAAAFDEPFADSAAFSSFIVSKLARKHVTVALSGDGGDELFAGYRRYAFFLGEERLRSMAPLRLRQLIFGSAGALYPKLDWAPRPLRFKTTFQALGQSTANGYAAASAINLASNATSLLSSDLQNVLDDYHPQNVISDAIASANTTESLSSAQHVDFLTWLPSRMLTKIDRTSMAHSLEVRPPMLDHHFVEWCATLPTSFKIKNGTQKRILKEALTPRLGHDHINRKKRGFDMPITKWLSANSNNLLERLRSSAAWKECGLVNIEAVENMIDAHNTGRKNYAQELWSVIMFDAFLRLDYST